MMVMVCCSVWVVLLWSNFLEQAEFTLPSIAEWCPEQSVRDGSSWVWHFLLCILPLGISPDVGSSDNL